MKINEVEKILGITKANIRFYEKENLITPSRTSNGYRDYSDSDIIRLKEIIIYRKLGLSVQQISDIFDGILPLQNAIAENILSIQQEINKLNGSLSLCRQLSLENENFLNTERYWEILHSQEAQGYQFQSLLNDYISFASIGYDWFLWPLPGESIRDPKKVFPFLLLLGFLNAITQVLTYHRGFLVSLLTGFAESCLCLLLWTATLFPLYLLSKRKPKLTDKIMTILTLVIPIIMIVFLVVISIMGYQSS